MPAAHDLELARLRDMTPAEKFAAAHSLWQTAWDLKAAGVRWLHPDWTEPQVLAEVRAIFGVWTG